VRELTYHRGVPVPYIATWSQEIAAAMNGAGGKGARLRMTKVMIPGTDREGPLYVAYEDETPGDRDAFGALWQRFPLAQGRGEPHFAKVHPQRRAMTRHLCQVCGNPADRDEHGWLWLVTIEDATRLSQGGEPRVRTANPPVCQRCCKIARDYCPHLLKGNAVVRTPGYLPWGVCGLRADPAGTSPGHTVAYGHQDIHRTIAGQMLVTLQDARVIDLHLTA
jgi:hypothetical protein